MFIVEIGELSDTNIFDSRDRKINCQKSIWA